MQEEKQIDAVLRRSEAQQKYMQARIDGQKESIDRLLKAREDETDSDELIAAMLTERSALQTTCLYLKGMLDEIETLLSSGVMDPEVCSPRLLAIMRTYAETKATNEDGKPSA